MYAGRQCGFDRRGELGRVIERYRPPCAGGLGDNLWVDAAEEPEHGGYAERRAESADVLTSSDRWKFQHAVDAEVAVKRADGGIGGRSHSATGGPRMSQP